MSAPKSPDPNTVPNLPPLKPRPMLFAVLGVILAIWLVMLVVMRLKTVDRPLTSPFSPTSQPSTSA